MSQLSKLKNHELMASLKNKSLAERKLTVEVIEHLEEVDRRSLHLQMGFGSLLEFCIKELSYSESAAYRRISAMRVSRELPQIKASLEEGKLNLVTVTQAQTFFRQERKYQAKVYSKQEKLEVLQSLENKSKRETEKILLAKSPQLVPPELVRQVSAEQTRITMNLDQALIEKLDLLKSGYSHLNPNPTYAELVELMACELLKKKTSKEGSAAQKETQKNAVRDQRRNIDKNIVHDQSRDNETIHDQSKDKKTVVLSQSKSCVAKPPEQKTFSRYIPASVRHYVFMRDQGCCSYQNLKTSKKCGSRFQLEIDHIKPFSYGGSNEAKNLRLVCRSHNQFFWRQVGDQAQNSEKKFVN